MIKIMKKSFGFLHAKKIAYMSPTTDMDLGFYLNKILPLKKEIDTACSKENPMIFCIQTTNFVN